MHWTHRESKNINSEYCKTLKTNNFFVVAFQILLTGLLFFCWTDLANSNNQQDIGSLQEKIKQDPNDDDSRNALESIYIKNKNYPELILVLKDAVDTNPQNPNNHYKLGLVYEFQKDYKSAVNCYKQAVLIDNDHTKALDSLGRVYTKIGDNISAKEFTDKAKISESKNIGKLPNRGLMASYNYFKNDKSQLPAIFSAIEDNDINEVRKLTNSKVNINYNYNDITPIMYASNLGRLEIVKYLAQSGADIHYVTTKSTPLFAAHVSNYMIKDDTRWPVVNYLIEKLLEPIVKYKKAKKSKFILPTVENIKSAISKALIEEGRWTNDAYGCIQLYDIIIENPSNGTFIVKCDAGIIDKNMTMMLDVVNASGNFMLAPKEVSTHAALTGPLPKEAGGAGMMGFIVEKVPKWTFNFSPGPNNSWSCKIQK